MSSRKEYEKGEKIYLLDGVWGRLVGGRNGYGVDTACAPKRGLFKSKSEARGKVKEKDFLGEKTRVVRIASNREKGDKPKES